MKITINLTKTEFIAFCNIFSLNMGFIESLPDQSKSCWITINRLEALAVRDLLKGMFLKLVKKRIDIVMSGKKTASTKINFTIAEAWAFDFVFSIVMNGLADYEFTIFRTILSTIDQKTA